MLTYKTVDGQEYQMVDNNSDITLGMYCRYVENQENLDPEEDDIDTCIKLIEIFSDLPFGTIDLENDELIRISEKLMFIQDEVIEDQSPRFRVDGTEYMIKPNMANITTGERKLIRQAMMANQDKNYKYLPHLCAALIRKAIVTKEITIDESGNEVSVVKYTQSPLNSMTPEGKQDFQDRVELFNKHLKLPNFAYLVKDFLASSTK